MDQIQQLLWEINHWRSDCLQAHSGQPHSLTDVVGQNSTITVSQPIFALHEASGTQEYIICDHAALLAHHHQAQLDNGSLFCCKCPVTGSDTVAPHDQKLQAYGCKFRPFS